MMPADVYVHLLLPVECPTSVVLEIIPVNSCSGLSPKSLPTHLSRKHTAYSRTDHLLVTFFGRFQFLLSKWYTSHPAYQNQSVEPLSVDLTTTTLPLKMPGTVGLINKVIGQAA
jgi:hypothetical protein